MRLPRRLSGAARILPPLFFAMVGIVTGLALMPAPAVPQVFQFWDKAQHALAYAALAVAGYVAFPARVWRVAFGLLAHGALIEVLQGALTTTRYADITDWFADTVGVCLGALLVRWALPAVMRRLQIRT